MGWIIGCEFDFRFRILLHRQSIDCKSMGLTFNMVLRAAV